MQLRLLILQISALIIFLTGPGLLPTTSRAADTATLTTPDGRIQIQAPDGYSERTPPRKEINLELVNEAEGTTLLIISENQKHFDSLQAYGELVRDTMTRKLKDPQADSGEKLELNGNPALRYEITGISNGLRMAFQVTIIQTETRFTQVVGSSLRAQFADHKQEFEKVGKTLKELPAKTEGQKERSLAVGFRPRHHNGWRPAGDWSALMVCK